MGRPALSPARTMELTRSLVEAKAEEYAEEEPLYAVEAEQIETLPTAFDSGEFGWRDAAWVVRWYYRRYLGAFPDDRRRAAEDAFGENDFETIRAAIDDVLVAEDTGAKLDRITDLSGVDVPIGSAFLQFLDPDAYLVVGDREWAVLRAAGELSEPYPDPPAPAEYETYLGAARALADRYECDLWTLYRALWRLHRDL